MKPSPHLGLAAGLLAASLGGACQHAAPAASQPPPRQGPTARTPVDGTPPVTLKIQQLEVDPAKTVRIRGVITSILGIRLLPAKVIFKISDSTETITVVINEQIQLKEGTEIELVGRYREMPAPMHSGEGEPPREAVFEVERYLDLH